MIKGVSKQILEVTNPENPYFEKIIFFVKSDCKVDDSKIIEREAEGFARLTQGPPKIKLKKGKIVKMAVGSVILTLTGIGLSFLLNLIV